MSFVSLHCLVCIYESDKDQGDNGIGFCEDEARKIEKKKKKPRQTNKQKAWHIEELVLNMSFWCLRGKVFDSFTEVAIWALVFLFRLLLKI